MLNEALNGSLLDNFFLALKIVWFLAPFLLPVIMVISLFYLWISYKRNLFWSEQDSTLLEIRLPKEINKSPAAMEMALNAFFHTVGERTFVHRILRGTTRHWFSLEIASIGGKVKFYIWTRKGQVSLVESALYAQYPGIEIHEVEDYTLPYSYNPEKNNIWCCEWKLGSADALPIKTYIDYGLDKDPKEEFKIEPMTSLLEFMGSITEGNAVWLQIVMRAHRKSRFADVFGEKPDAWKEEAKKEMEKVIEKYRPKEKDKQSRQPTEGEKETINAISRSASKLPFDVGIRTLYIYDNDKFNGANIGGVTGAFRQYSYGGLNSFVPNAGVLNLDFFWEDPFHKIIERRKKQMLAGYKARQAFYAPYKVKSIFVLNAEELATIFHFPGQVAGTPTLERVPSKKSEAPANLPI